MKKIPIALNGKNVYIIEEFSQEDNFLYVQGQLSQQLISKEHFFEILEQKSNYKETKRFEYLRQYCSNELFNSKLLDSNMKETLYKMILSLINVGWVVQFDINSNKESLFNLGFEEQELITLNLQYNNIPQVPIDKLEEVIKYYSVINIEDKCYSKTYILFKKANVPKKVLSQQLLDIFNQLSNNAFDLNIYKSILYYPETIIAFTKIWQHKSSSLEIEIKENLVTLVLSEARQKEIEKILLVLSDISNLKELDIRIDEEGDTIITWIPVIPQHIKDYIGLI